MTDPQIWAITENMVDPVRIARIPEEEVAWVAHNLTHLGIDDWNYFFVEAGVKIRESEFGPEAWAMIGKLDDAGVLEEEAIVWMRKILKEERERRGE